MKIAILVGAFPPKWLAGTEIATYNIAKHLARRGHEVHVITTLDEGLPKESMENGFYVHRIPRQKVRFFGITSFWMKILRLLKKINPDIVHAQGIGIGIHGFLAKKILKKPYVTWGQGSEVYLPWRFKKPTSNSVIKNADAVIALTEDMKKEIEKFRDRDIFVIPNGIDLERFEKVKKDFYNNFKKSDENIILFVGGLKPIKGVEYLIESMRITIKQKLVRLLLIGEGEERNNLENLVKELNLEKYVKFIGKVPNELIPEYMAASDVFVLPSLSEGFPLVLLEAIASGLPIVATKVRGIPEIVRDGVNGFLAEPKNPEAIAEKVLMLLEDDELREKISRNNKEKAKEYAWNNISTRLERIYLECLRCRK